VQPGIETLRDSPAEGRRLSGRELSWRGSKTRRLGRLAVTRIAPWSIALIVAGFSTPLIADDDREAVSSALSRQLLEDGQALTEMQQFTESRVPKMPEVSSLAEWQAHADRMRAEVLNRVIFRGEAAAWRDAKARVEWLGQIPGGIGYRIKRLRYEALPGLWIPALLYEPETLRGKVPVILNVNGHDRPFGKAATYKQARCINQAKRGMIALNVEWLGMGQLGTSGYDHPLINAINLCGTGGIATHYLAMTRAIDLLLAHEHADPDRLAVTGLSGGGWQTIFVSAFDTRVKLTDPVAGYSSFRTRVRHFSDLGDSEQTPCDLATMTDYAQMTAMMAPRPTLLTFNAADNCCFRADHALSPLLDAARPIFRLYGKGHLLRAHVNEYPGDHNYGLDNRQALYRMLGDVFYPDDRAYDATEIPCDSELKTREQLQVELPPDNLDFHTLALQLCRDLPRHPDLPTDSSEATRRRKLRRDKLRDLVRFHDYDVEADSHDVTKGPLTASRWTLKIGDDWTVPAVELARGEARATAVLIADAGRKSASAVAADLLSSGHRVLAVDPFSLGESRVGHHEDLFALLVSAVGERPLGLQASQLAAIARWARGKYGEPVTLVAIGPRTSVAALVAAGVEDDAIGRLELHRAPGSLKEAIETKAPFESAPELFCFGLLEAFDIPQLAALVAPRPIAFKASSDRLKAEFARFQGGEHHGNIHFDETQ
jgi:dienelactone hydrolase